jgi:hypothetical protein
MPRRPPTSHKDPVLTEHLDSVVAGIGNIEVSIGAYVNIPRREKQPRPGSIGTEDGHSIACRVELLNSSIVRICHVEIAVVEDLR